jgi:hypothetical protein
MYSLFLPHAFIGPFTLLVYIICNNAIGNVINKYFICYVVIIGISLCPWFEVKSEALDVIGILMQDF